MTIDYLLTLVGSAAATFALIALGQPLLRQFALAQPNARSAHKVPTPQGGGIVVIATTVAIVAIAAYCAALTWNWIERTPMDTCGDGLSCGRRHDR